MHCKACNRETSGRDFCPSHLKAYENIVANYSIWKKALGISWKDYISKIEKNSLTGEYAKEVAKHLTNNEEAKKCHEKLRNKYNQHLFGQTDGSAKSQQPNHQSS